MGRDCDFHGGHDLRGSLCFNSVVSTMRFYINMSENYDRCEDDGEAMYDHWLFNMLHSPEGTCMECFHELRHRWFKSIDANGNAVPTEAFVSEIRELYPDYDGTKPLKMYARYENAIVPPEVALLILSKYVELTKHLLIVFDAQEIAYNLMEEYFPKKETTTTTSTNTKTKNESILMEMEKIMTEMEKSFAEKLDLLKKNRKLLSDIGASTTETTTEKSS